MDLASLPRRAGIESPMFGTKEQGWPPDSFLASGLPPSSPERQTFPEDIRIAAVGCENESAVPAVSHVTHTDKTQTWAFSRPSSLSFSC